MATLLHLKSQGKIRHIGVSNFAPPSLRRAIACGEVVSNQVAYNLLFRAVEFEILPFCREHRIPILCYSPLMQGLLTGKFSSPDEVPPDRARTRHFSSARPRARHGEPGAEKETFAAIGHIRKVAERLGQPMAHLALAWLLAQPGVGAVLVGARNAEQARFNAQCSDLSLPPDALDELTRIAEPLKAALGPNPDMWQSTSRVM